jgi:hypothetical protein
MTSMQFQGLIYLISPDVTVLLYHFDRTVSAKIITNAVTPWPWQTGGRPGSTVTLQLFAVPKSFFEFFPFSSSNARIFISPHNTYLFALKISGFALHRPPERNSTKELVSQRFWTTCMDFRVLQAIQDAREKHHITTLFDQLVTLSQSSPLVIARKKKDIIIHHQYSKDLKRWVIYQSTTLGKSSTKIAKSLNMNVRVVQRVLHTWKEIGEVCWDRTHAGRAPIMVQASVAVCTICIFSLISNFQQHSSCYHWSSSSLTYTWMRSKSSFEISMTSMPHWQQFTEHSSGSELGQKRYVVWSCTETYICI